VSPIVTCTVGVIFCALTLACDTPCERPGYDDGEHVRVTILSAENVMLAPDGCYFKIGDSFTLVANDFVEDNRGCEVGAVGSAPLGGSLSCSPYMQLGQTCVSLQREPQEADTLWFELRPDIQRSDRIRDDMKLRFVWTHPGGQRCGGTYNVRIEMIDRP
jgi:hypothetical protein